MMLILNVMLGEVHASEPKILKVAKGVGYREQEL